MTVSPLALEAIKRAAKKARISSDKYHYQDVISRLALPEPYPLQAEIIGSKAKRKVICAGRRAGKTQLAAIRAVRGLLEGHNVLLTSTSQDQADVFWRRITQWTVSLADNGLCKNETKRVLQYRDGRLRVKTGRDPDVLRGEDADLLILDECAIS